jgi:DNA-binding transcriptional LysR family regulator
MPTSFDGLREFVCVAEAGGFTTAAQRMGTTKSLVSQRVSNLERRLGVRLFDRTTRRLHMTEAGTVYLDFARRIMAEAGAAEEAVHRLGGEPRGHLRVGTTVAFAILFLARHLNTFRADYPGISIEIITEETVMDPVRAGVDVAIRFATEPRPGTIARKVADITYVLCAAPAYLSRAGEPRHSRDLAGHPALTARADAATVTWRLARNGEQVVIEARAPVRCASGIVVRELALAGHGVALLNRFAVEDDLAAGRLLQVLPDWTPQTDGPPAMWIVLPDNRSIPPKVRVFIDFVIGAVRAVDRSSLST